MPRRRRRGPKENQGGQDWQRPERSSNRPCWAAAPGHEIARSTIAGILERHGIEPAPERSRETTWKEFLSRHWELIVAADFFTVEVWTRKGLQRFVVLIHDRDPLFTTEFLEMVAEVGVKSVKLPPRSPNLNAHAERFVRTIKESCLERMILFGEESLRTATLSFVAHYHTERNHQGLANRLISPDVGHLGNAGVVQRRQRLGGMLNYYYRAAA